MEVGVSGADAIRDVLFDLYSHVFKLQARVICYLSSAELARAWEVTRWND